MYATHASTLMPDDASQYVAAIPAPRGRREPATTRSRSKRFPGRPLSRQALRVLVVDNDRSMAAELAAWLQYWGHDPVVAHDRTTAISAATTHYPQLVLLALEMPRVDGCQLARQLHDVLPNKTCLFIGVAWQADDERRRQFIEAGIDLLLAAPIELLLVKTLLMLESARTQRLKTEACVGLIGKGDPTL